MTDVALTARDKCKTEIQIITDSEKKFELFIPPWALSREEIPLHIEWTNSNVDLVTVKIPANFDIYKIINSEHVQSNDDGQNIEMNFQPKYFDFLEKNFLGIIVKSKDIIKETTEAFPVLVQYKFKSEVLESLSGDIHLFRPFLNVSTDTKKIVFDDSQTKTKIMLNAEKVGFGDIEIKPELSFKGKVISYGGDILDDMYIEIIHKLFQIYLEDVDKGWNIEVITKSEIKALEEIEFESKFLNEIIQHVNEKINEGLVVIGDVEKAEIDLFELWLEEYLDKGELYEIIPILVKRTLANTILSYLGETLSESTRTESSKFRVNSRIKSPISNLDLYIRYRDLKENEYEPVLIPISVEDKRSNPSKIFIKLEMKFTDIKDNTIKDYNELIKGE